MVMPDKDLLAQIDKIFKDGGCDCARCVSDKAEPVPATVPDFSDWSASKLSDTKVPVSVGYILTVEAALKAYRSQVLRSGDGSLDDPLVAAFLKTISLTAISILDETTEKYLQSVK